jgi:hypothetical protein
MPKKVLRGFRQRITLSFYLFPSSTLCDAVPNMVLASGIFGNRDVVKMILTLQSLSQRGINGPLGH